MNNNSEYQIFIFANSTTIPKWSIIYIWVMERKHMFYYFTVKFVMNGQGNTQH